MVAMLVLVIACLLTILSACLENELTGAHPFTILDARVAQKTYVVVAMVESHMFARIENGAVGWLREEAASNLLSTVGVVTIVYSEGDMPCWWSCSCLSKPV
jgi:hypothetical protein